MSDIQIIGFDCGRGYVKAYSEVNNMVKEVMFKSVIGDGRENKVEYGNYENPIFISYNESNYFIGTLAEKESYMPIRNSQDSKVSHTVKVLLASVLSQIAVKDRVKLMIGVPYKSYSTKTLKEVQEEYKGKTFNVKDQLNGSSKSILIEDVDIFREGDAALFHAIKFQVNETKPVGLVNVGFKTLELSYFGKGLNFNDSLSNTVEYGQGTMLKIIKDKLMGDGIYKDITEIDSSSDYDDMKKEVYELGSQKVKEIIAEIWVNKGEMDVYLAGGTSLNLNLENGFIKLPDAQMATAKGLFEIAKVQS